MADLDPAVLAAVAAAPPDEREVLVCYVAGRAVDIPADELNGALRRAELLLAAGGDPRRPLEPDGRAVTALADDLDAPERRLTLVGCLHTIGIDEAASLAADPDRAWRTFAMALLADALAPD